MIKLFTLFALLLLNQASAADLFTPNADNWVIKILNQIFGSLFPGSISVSPLSGPMQIFNEGVLLLAGVYASYTLCAGIIGSAHEGQVLGKKISSVWMPIRYALATPLLLPLFNGFCLAQVVIAWLAIQGNGLADAIYKSYVSRDNSAIVAIAGEDFTGIKPIVYNMYQSYGCLHALKKELNGSGNIDDILLNGADKSSILSVWTEENAKEVKYYFGDKDERFFSKDICGVIKMPKIKVPTITTSSTTDQALIIDFDSAPALNEKVQTVQKAAFASILSKVDTLASQTISNGKLDYTLIDDVVNNYQDQLKQISASVVQSIDGLNTLSKNAQKGGWITFYTYFMQYAYLHDQISTALHNVPIADGPTNAGHESLSGNFSTTIVPILKTVVDGGAVPTFGGYNKDGSSKDSSNSGFIDKISDFINKIKPTELLKQVFIDTQAHFQAKDGEFPIYTMIRQGDILFGTASISLGAAGTSLFFLGAHPGISAFISTVITIVFVPMLITGFILKWYLPFLSFMIGVGVLGAIVMGTAVSILLAPVFVMGHLNPHADDLVGSSGNGYRVLLSMTLRPALTTLGVAISFSAILAMGKYINQTMTMAFMLSQSGSGFWTVIVDFIAAPALYGILMYKTIIHTLPYSHKIADEILQIVGGGGVSPGHMAGAISGEEQHQAAAGAVAGLAGGLAGAAGARRNQGQGDGKGEGGSPFKEKGGKPGIDGKLGGFKANAGSEDSGDGKKAFSDEKLAKSELAKVISGNAPVMMNARQAALNSRMNEMSSNLSEASQSKMNSAITDSINNPEHADWSDEQHMDEGFKVGLNNEFGAGAGAMIKSVSSKGFDSPESKDMVKTYQQAKASFQAASPYATSKEVLSSLSKATSEAKSDFISSREGNKHKEDGKSVGQFVSESFNRNLGLDSNKDFDATPKNIEPKEEPKIDDKKE